MSPLVVLAILLGLAIADDKPYSGHKVIRVIPKNAGDIQFLKEFGQDEEVDFWSEPSEAGSPVEINVGRQHFVKLSKGLKRRGMKYELYIDDVQKAIDNENKGTQHLFSSIGFDYAKYNTLSSINAELSNLANQYSNIVSKFVIGTSYQKRSMYAMKIQSQKISSNKKVIFIDCGIHAREWITPATCMYMLKQLLEKYTAGDREVMQLVQKYDWVILPVFNVDGYEYTHNGRRLWRKTMSDNAGYNCKGADPNRNWNYRWGGVGTSSYPCQDTYHGKKPFSEVEVASVARYLYGIRTKLIAYYNIHAYSQLWMTPWSYTTTYPRDYAEIKRVADIATRALTSVHQTSYRVGPPSRVIYSVSGGSIDWTYGVLGVKYSYALELRDKGQYGFILPASQIIPTGEETFKALLAAAKEYQ
ncbi:carboxypeptidase B-like [Rhopilema esculentum]|uniref:carboxypeptidase B-like n=1 Tax=Rhopilema esculentum TaxID=499914 RepID=UPI0031D3B33A